MDKQIRKENKRRNILLNDDNNNVYRDQLFNFFPNLNFQHILEIYGFDSELSVNNINVNNNKKNNDDVMMNDDYINIGATLPDTLDINMDYEFTENNLLKRY